MDTKAMSESHRLFFYRLRRVARIRFFRPANWPQTEMEVNSIVQPISLTPLLGQRSLDLSRPLVMGIINVTPDSFSDGGRFYALDAAVIQALQMEADGADIIDIGGESSRPGAAPVDAEEEARRVIPVIRGIRRSSCIPISVDTYRAETARQAIEAGADIINDISALRMDPALAQVIVETRAPVVLMHMQGTPQTMQQNPHYDDCLKEVGEFFDERIRFCTRSGVSPDRLILDPGLGFGKRLEDNVALLAGLETFKRFGIPILVGASRKSFINLLAPSSHSAQERLGGSLAAALTAVANGANIVRVHDVAPTVEALKVFRALRNL